MKDKTIAVYRFLSKEEFDSWIKNDKEKISFPYKEDGLVNCNNHSYRENVKFVHFFKNLSDAHTVCLSMKEDIQHLCKFEIAKKILTHFEGKGKYYDDNLCVTDVVEYAIPLELIDTNCLKEFRIVKDTNEAKYIRDNQGWEKICDLDAFEKF